ncbi:MAG: hypothetical protein R6U84_06705 [Candidatus Cloacimonadales bacterium]
MKKNVLLHLIGEVSNYILEKDPRRMVLSLHQEEDGVHLCVLDNNTHTDEEVESMRKLMNTPKRPELSGYYGAMTGHDTLGSARLGLLGWQVKHSDVVRTSEGIRIDLWLGGDRFESEDFTIPTQRKKKK